MLFALWLLGHGHHRFSGSPSQGAQKSEVEIVIFSFDGMESEIQQGSMNIGCFLAFTRLNGAGKTGRHGWVHSDSGYWCLAHWWPLRDNEITFDLKKYKVFSCCRFANVFFEGMSDAVSTTTTPPEPAKTRLFGMQIPIELDALLSETASRHNLTKSGIARMALERGLPILNEQLSQPQPQSAE